MATKRLLEILWPGLLIYIQEVFWVGNQGEGTSPCCTLFFSDLELLLAFHYDWENETILPGALRHFKRYQTCMVTYLYILYCMDFSVNLRWWGEGEMMSVPGPSCRPSVQGVNPQCAASWMTYARDSFVDSPSVLCPLEGGAQTHWHRHQSYRVKYPW